VRRSNPSWPSYRRNDPHKQKEKENASGDYLAMHGYKKIKNQQWIKLTNSMSNRLTKKRKKDNNLKGWMPSMMIMT
jgi:hypothetical protein